MTNYLANVVKLLLTLSTLLLLSGCGESSETLMEAYYRCIGEDLAIYGDYSLDEIKEYCALETGYYEDIDHNLH